MGPELLLVRGHTKIARCVYRHLILVVGCRIEDTHTTVELEGCIIYQPNMRPVYTWSLS